REAVSRRDTAARLPLHGMLKIVVNCGRCEAFIGRCLDSLKRQSYPHWQAFVTVDRRGDATYERAIAARDGDARIPVTQNERRLGTALRTWKRWLFDLIDSRDFRDEHGRWLRVSEDLACMFPMLEMATTRRAHHIAEPLMLYNRLSHHDPKRRLAEEGIRNAAWLRTKPRYAPLSFTNADEQSSLQTEVRF